MHSPILNSDLMCRESGKGSSVLSIQDECSEERVMGDVAREGLELARSGGDSISNI